jgi:hypothetical protein
LDVHVLYCGDPGSSREADFRSFLEKHFTKVTVVDLSKFKEEQAKREDVVLFDWTPIYDGKGGVDLEKMKRLDGAVPKMSQEFSRPAILIGYAGGKVVEELHLKIDWFCNCLSDKARNLAVDHAVFHAPLEVEPQFEEIPTPERVPFLTLDRSIGPTMKVWRVQTKDYPEVDPGLVSTLYGFTDSPDAEVIGQGIADKSPDTVALARQANSFLWGFSAPPSEMTPAGQRLFVNIIVYMRQFDGQAPIVRSIAKSREWALIDARTPRFMSDEYLQAQRRDFEKLLVKNPGWIPKEYNGNAKAYGEAEKRRLHEAYSRSMEQKLPEPLRKEFGLDAEKYITYYKENLEYLRPVGGEWKWDAHFVVDEDAKAIKSSNRQIGTLDRCVSMLEKKDRPELALRLLKRYTEESFETPSQWRGWLGKNRSRMFFSDVGGYKFFLDTRPVQASKKH